MIDLRSDTVTKPTEEMREVMINAEVGDDVYGEDPSINKLEELASKVFDKEDALFVPSGTMGNQIAINVHTSPGDEVILDEDCHIANYEMGAMAEISGAMPKTIESKKPYIPTKKAKKGIRDEKYYLSNTSLIAIENTHNAKGGLVYPKEKIDELSNLAKEHELPVHLDGARIFNASIASEKKVDEITENVQSVMFCLSKGLGAPVGSVLVGKKSFIKRARETRKTMGGGMRQAGFLAKAGSFALKNNVARLKKDHMKAQQLAKILKKDEKIEVKEPETNIVVFEPKRQIDPKKVLKELESKDIKITTIGDRPKLRAVTHLDVSKEEVKEAGEKIRELINKAS